MTATRVSGAPPSLKDHTRRKVTEEFASLADFLRAEILRAYRPHIFFDDQLTHIEGAAQIAPSVHVPFGVANT